MNELTEQEKQFLIELISKLQFNVDGIEQAQIAKTILSKLSNTPVVGEVVKTELSTK